MSSYVRQLWVDDDPLFPASAARFLHIENGIDTAQAAAETSLANSITALASASAAQSTSAKDAANGYAGLDSGGLLKVAELPTTVATVRTGSASALPTFYAPAPTGVAATDTANLTALFNAINATNGAALFVGGGTYVLNSLLPQITVPLRLQGASAGIVPASAAGTVFSFSAGVVGLNFSAAAQMSAVQDLYLKSASSALGTDDGIISLAHGLVLDRVVIDGFGRDGIHMDTTSSGNCNNSSITNVRSVNNKRDGYRTAGGNSNVITFENASAVNNAGWGFTSSAAACLFLNAHTDSNTLGAYNDTGNGNTFILPYVETGVGSNVSLSGNGTTWLEGTFTSSVITNTATNANVLKGGAWQKALRMTDPATGHQWAFNIGSFGSGYFSLADNTNSKNIFDVDAADTRAEWLIPLLDATFLTVKDTPAYSASIAVDGHAGQWKTITVTNTSAFTINTPSNSPTAGQSATMHVEVVNSSGGTMGAITWGAGFVFAGITWVNPANGKKRWVRFNWNGISWIGTGLAAADY